MSYAADIAYTRQGSGDPLVLIHGVGHRRRAWKPVMAPLAERFDVVAIDLPGFGESAPLPPGTPYSIDSTVRRLQTFFAAIDLARPHVAGNSLGGALALELGARDLVATVTAFAPAGFWVTPRERRYAISVLRVHRWLAGMPVPIARRIAGRPELRAQAGRFLYTHAERIAPDDFLADSRALHDCVGFDGTMSHGRSYVCAAQPTVATTVAWGTRDRILPYRQSAVARDRLPGASFVPLVGSGHVPMYDDPDGVVAAIVTTSG